MPLRGQPNNTMNISPKKDPLPLALCHWKKNQNVLSNSITQARPDRNRIFPIANRPLSNSRQTPRNVCDLHHFWIVFVTLIFLIVYASLKLSLDEAVEL